MIAADSDTTPVTATVLRLERAASAGTLLALAEVEIEIAGVALVLHGVRVIRTGPRSRGVASPCYRVANGRIADAISLPPELAVAIARVVLDEYEAMRRPVPAARAAGIGEATLAPTSASSAPNMRQRAP